MKGGDRWERKRIKDKEGEGMKEESKEGNKDGRKDEGRWRDYFQRFYLKGSYWHQIPHEPRMNIDMMFTFTWLIHTPLQTTVQMLFTWNCVHLRVGNNPHWTAVLTPVLYTQWAMSTAAVINGKAWRGSSVSRDNAVSDSGFRRLLCFSHSQSQ